LTYLEARRRALDAGATQQQIDKEAEAIKRGSYGSRPIVRAMIKALQMHSWCNTPSDWARLAGALKR
jgi:hypothetical protein